MSGLTGLRETTASVPSKQISSRLLNMKFMQRAAASDKTKSPRTPSTPNSEPPYKRRRTGDHLPLGRDSSSTPTSAISTHSHADRVATPSALKVQLEGSSISLGQRILGSENNETEWSLDVNFPAMNGQSIAEGEDSMSESDEDEDGIWSTSLPIGRQTYGSFKKKVKNASTTTPGVTPVSSSKSGKRNSAKKRTSGDAALSASSNSELESGEASDPESFSDSNNEDSNSEEEEDEESNIYASSRAIAAQNKKTKGPDYTSKAAMRKMDETDYHKKGFAHGLGRSRAGLAGGGGGGDGSGKRKGNGDSHRNGPGASKGRNGLAGQGMFGQGQKGGNRDRKKRKTM